MKYTRSSSRIAHFFCKELELSILGYADHMVCHDYLTTIHHSYVKPAINVYKQMSIAVFQ